MACDLQSFWIPPALENWIHVVSHWCWNETIVECEGWSLGSTISNLSQAIRQKNGVYIILGINLIWGLILVGVLLGCYFGCQMSVRPKTRINGCSPVKLDGMALTGDSLPPCGQLWGSPLSTHCAGWLFPAAPELDASVFSLPQLKPDLWEHHQISVGHESCFAIVSASACGR